MAEQYIPGMQMQDWTKSPSLTGDVLGGIVRSAIGVPLAALAQSVKDKFSGSSEESPEGAVPPPEPIVQQFQPASAFPEVTQQQYVSPYAPAYTPPGSAPPPLQGFMTPGMMNTNQMGMPPPTNMQGFRTNTSVPGSNTMDLVVHPMVQQIWNNQMRGR